MEKGEEKRMKQGRQMEKEKYVQDRWIRGETSTAGWKFSIITTQLFSQHTPLKPTPHPQKVISQPMEPETRGV